MQNNLFKRQTPLTFFVDSFEPFSLDMFLPLDGFEPELSFFVDVIDDPRVRVLEVLKVLVRQATDDL
jgi:hypothetical protein